MFLASFIFDVSHLRIHPAVNLNTLRALTSSDHCKKKLIKSVVALSLSSFRVC